MAMVPPSERSRLAHRSPPPPSPLFSPKIYILYCSTIYDRMEQVEGTAAVKSDQSDRRYNVFYGNRKSQYSPPRLFSNKEAIAPNTVALVERDFVRLCSLDFPIVSKSLPRQMCAQWKTGGGGMRTWSPYIEFMTWNCDETRVTPARSTVKPLFRRCKDIWGEGCLDVYKWSEQCLPLYIALKILCWDVTLKWYFQRFLSFSGKNRDYIIYCDNEQYG